MLTWSNTIWHTMATSTLVSDAFILYTRAKIDQVDARLFVEQRLNNVVIKVRQHLLNWQCDDEYCSINSCSMLSENNSCYNVVRTWADNSWWKKLVDRCQQWLNNGCWTWTTVNNGCWQQLLTGCSTTLLNSVQHNIAASCWQHWSSCSFLRV